MSTSGVSPLHPFWFQKFQTGATISRNYGHVVSSTFNKRRPKKKNIIRTNWHCHDSSTRRSRRLPLSGAAPNDANQTVPAPSTMIARPPMPRPDAMPRLRCRRERGRERGSERRRRLILLMCMRRLCSPTSARRARHASGRDLGNGIMNLTYRPTYPFVYSLIYVTYLPCLTRCDMSYDTIPIVPHRYHPILRTYVTLHRPSGAARGFFFFFSHDRCIDGSLSRGRNPRHR